MHHTNLNRRELFGFLFKRSRKLAKEKVDIALNQPTEAKFRPPGSAPEELFTSRCHGCESCAAHCPHDVILMTPVPGKNYRTPELVPGQSPCLMCEDVPCSQVCPTDAILPCGPKDIKIGVAAFLEANCLIPQKVPCSYCVDYCPLKNEAIAIGKKNGLPEINTEVCTGCGACEYYCPANAKAIYIRPRESA